MSHLINIYLEPVKVFTDLREKPTFLVPTLLALLVATVAILAYHLHVDPQWFVDHRNQAMAGQMTKAELEQVSAMLPGARVSGYIGVAMVVVMTAVIYPLLALYYLLVGKITGKAVGFRHGLALTAWGGMPMLFASVIALIGTFTSSPQTSFESLQLLSIDPLFVQLPLDHPWSTLAKSVNLLCFWVMFLVALGWKTWFRTGWGQALAIAVFPWLLYFGALSIPALV
ncbi:YIP1 family protein [Arenimonas daejeonensis]|uniref:YIP1 family protein n=1 Tax=Arenimonas daejeonensis TaxID=370777 RepID=UPI0013153FDA|nr:YIP1 family protein [Arenimonas daejeonensis]